jgi:hypothetical protein
MFSANPHYWTFPMFYARLYFTRLTLALCPYSITFNRIKYNQLHWYFRWIGIFRTDKMQNTNGQLHMPMGNIEWWFKQYNMKHKTRIETHTMRFETIKYCKVWHVKIVRWLIHLKSKELLDPRHTPFSNYSLMINCFQQNWIMCEKYQY